MKHLSVIVLGLVMTAAGSAAAANFIAQGDGTVYDPGTALLWQQTENARMSWQAAADRCDGLNLAGRTDWRLPTREELLTLVDRGRKDPAIDTRHFPKTKSTAYWTATRENDRIWGIGFSDGEEFVFGGTDLALYVRCVANAGSGSPAVTASAPIAKPDAPTAAKPGAPPAPSLPSPPVKTAAPGRPGKSSPAVAAPAVPTTPAPSPSPSTPAQTPLPDPADTLRRWAAAWAKQDVAAYLSFYGEKFSPPGNLGRTQWEQQRHRALTRPKWIKVDLGEMEVARNGDEVRLEFVQTYRSDVFQDRVRKAVVLAREGDRWAIVSEEALPSRP